MRIISRQPTEALIIGDTITLTVLDIRDDHIYIGIDAPKEISVQRGEVYASIKAGEKAPSFNLTLQSLILQNFSLKLLG